MKPVYKTVSERKLTYCRGWILRWKWIQANFKDWVLGSVQQKPDHFYKLRIGWNFGWVLHWIGGWTGILTHKPVPDAKRLNVPSNPTLGEIQTSKTMDYQSIYALDEGNKIFPGYWINKRPHLLVKDEALRTITRKRFFTSGRSVFAIKESFLSHFWMASQRNCRINNVFATLERNRAAHNQGTTRNFRVFVAIEVLKE